MVFISNNVKINLYNKYIPIIISENKIFINNKLAISDAFDTPEK